jgi:hypothetical protein
VGSPLDGSARRQKAEQVIRQLSGTARRWLSGPTDVIPLACIVLAVLAANLPAILHLVTRDPLIMNAYLTEPTSRLLTGLPYIDPNAGSTTQALGHLAALDWLHGHVPWWNPFEGMGAPLAAEMQGGAFFPTTLLLALHGGPLLVQLVLEAFSGCSAYFLARRLGVGRTLSTAAGVAFGLCGTYAWLAHAPIRPVALLPLCLLGVERALDAARERRPGGWCLLAVALALSVLAGFPEATFIDALFVAWWAVLRIVGPGRSHWLPLVRKLGTGVVAGMALAAPLILAFVEYLPYANIGSHQGQFSKVSLPTFGLAQLILPYALGPIFGFNNGVGPTDTISLLWGSVGGFLTVTVVAAGLVGLVGARHRTLRIGLGAWILICLLRTYGFPPVVRLMEVVPGVRLTAFYRYADGSWELAVVVLAALGLDDIARNFTRRRALVVSALVTGVLAVWAAVVTFRLLTPATGPAGAQEEHRHYYALGSLALALGALTVLAIGGLLASRRLRSPTGGRAPLTERSETRRKLGRILMAGIVSVESILLLGFTYLSAPRPIAVQSGSVTWLQEHLGSYRFVTLGPIQPDYGSYYGIAEANVNDLPFPKAWSTYIGTHLDTNAPPLTFNGDSRVSAEGPTAAQELTAHVANYESVGIRYVVEKATGVDFQGQAYPEPGTPPWPAGPRLVYRDSFAEIWQLPDAAPAFALHDEPSASGHDRGDGSCSVTGSGWNRATVHCSHPTILVRRVLYMPGWTASYGGASSAVGKDRTGPHNLFQSVAVPAGTTTVRFTYLPRHETAALVIALLAALAIVASQITRRRWRRVGRPRAPDR